jgi:uncharacterized metal-binding protein YceD (DUF177 family)
MKHGLPIYVDRLLDGHVEKMSERIDPQLLDIVDDEIGCKEPVAVSIEAYIADEFLLVTLSLQAELLLHCSVCNEEFQFPIAIEREDQEIELDEVKEGAYNVLPLIREVLLVALPLYPQCGGDCCLNRSKIEKYFAKEHKSYNPFESL